MICKHPECEKVLNRKNQSGFCNQHPTPEMIAKRGAGIKRRYDTDPDFRARQKAGAGNRSEAGRRALSERAKAQRLWEQGRASFTPETHKKRARAIRDRLLSHIPREYRDLYSELRNKWRLSVEDALAAVQQQQDTDLARIRRELRAA